MVFLPRIRYTIYVGLAAAVLLVVSCVIYRAGVRYGVQSQLEISRNVQSELEKQLEQERQQSANVAKRLENELGEEQWSFIEGCQRDWNQLPPPDGPLTVGIDGGYIRGRNKQGHFID